MTIDSRTISSILPHRFPFLLLDKVTELNPGKSAVGVKNVTINEPYFVGHFPTEPIVPGVLLVESLAQLTAIMYCSEFIPEIVGDGELQSEKIDSKDISSKVGYLVEIKNIRFKKVVRPGDTLVLRTFKKSAFGLLSQVKVDAFVNNECVLDGLITVSQHP